MIQRYDVHTSYYGSNFEEEDDGGRYCLSEDVEKLEHELEEVKEKYRWRDVNEELPEPYQYMPCLNNSNKPLCAYWNPKEKFFMDSEGCYRDVIKWMPIPQPAKEVGL